MADDIIFTELLLNPPVASTEQTVHVKWQVGVDVNWYPSGSDEVRVFNTAGVLHCIQQMWNCDALGAQQTYSRGSGTITAPASEGAYVVCLYDFASKRRVFSSTLRVAGSKVGLPQEIDIKQAESAPHGCIDVSYNPHSLYGGFLALFPLAHPDNNGMNGHNESPFGCALVAVRTPTPDLLEGFDTTTFGFVAPQHVGEYQVRYLKTCRTNVLRSVALSNTFTVRGVAVEESVSSQAVRGKLTLPGAPRAGVKVGDLITVAWDITEGCAVLSELDCIFLYPYGRPEAVRQTDEICTVSTAPLSKWRVELHAPHEAGRYEAGYFSHRLQKFVLDGPSILVVGEHAKFTVDVDNIVSSIGEPVKVSWSIDEIVHRREDRCRIYDVGMNLYGSVPISDGCGFEENDTEEPLAAANEVLFARRMCGTLELRCDRPGRFIAVYYSSLLRRDVAKTEPFRITMQEDSLYYSRAIEVALTARLRQAPSMQICVKYTVSSSHGDTYGRLAARDCIGLFREGDRDCVAHHAFGSSHEIPALRLFWVDERESETIVFPAISTPGRYHVRYLTPTSLGRWGSVAQCAFEIVTEEVELQGGWVVEPFGQIPTTELAPVEVTLPDDDGDGLLQKATHCPRKAGIQGVTASLDAVPASRRAKSSSVILHYFPTPDFKGAVMVPHSVPFGDPVIVTYHVLEGKPLASDKIVIVDEFCTHVFAEASLGEASLGRENYTLGTVLLKPPRTQGLFMAAYYSIELRSVVVTSPLFRIRKSSIENVVSPVGKKVVEADRKSTVCKTGIREARFRAVLVGAQCSNASCSIRGTSNDVEMFRDCLLDNFPHATPDSILTLSDIEGAADPAKIPNAYNIRRGMEWLLEDSRPKDQIVFYFTGLGSRVNDYGHTELDEYDCCILPSYVFVDAFFLLETIVLFRQNSTICQTTQNNTTQRLRLA